MKGIMAYEETPLVSMDFMGDLHSSTVDAATTKVIGNLVKVLAWYDNEMGYSQRMIDVAKYMASKQ
jgi:glyceraldehyde 3-phosphate dehydrogenase